MTTNISVFKAGRWFNVNGQWFIRVRVTDLMFIKGAGIQRDGDTVCAGPFDDKQKMIDWHRATIINRVPLQDVREVIREIAG